LLIVIHIENTKRDMNEIENTKRDMNGIENTKRDMNGIKNTKRDMSNMNGIVLRMENLFCKSELFFYFLFFSNFPIFLFSNVCKI